MSDLGSNAVEEGTSSSGAVSNEMLRDIVEKGFFDVPGSLARARAACAELIFARALIQAQTAHLGYDGSRQLKRAAAAN